MLNLPHTLLKTGGRARRCANSIPVLNHESIRRRTTTATASIIYEEAPEDRESIFKIEVAQVNSTEVEEATKEEVSTNMTTCEEMYKTKTLGEKTLTNMLRASRT